MGPGDKWFLLHFRPFQVRCLVQFSSHPVQLALRTV